MLTLQRLTRSVRSSFFSCFTVICENHSVFLHEHEHLHVDAHFHARGHCWCMLMCSTCRSVSHAPVETTYTKDSGRGRRMQSRALHKQSCLRSTYKHSSSVRRSPTRTLAESMTQENGWRTPSCIHEIRHPKADTRFRDGCRQLRRACPIRRSAAAPG